MPHRLLLHLWSGELKLSSVFSRECLKQSSARSAPQHASAYLCVCVCSLHKECLAASCVEWDYVNMLICPQWRHSHQRLHAIVKRDRQWERKGGREGVEKMSGRAVKVWCAIWSSVTNRVNAERSFDGRVRTGLRMKMKKKACKWKQQDRWARWKVLRWFAWK